MSVLPQEGAAVRRPGWRVVWDAEDGAWRIERCLYGLGIGFTWSCLEWMRFANPEAAEARARVMVEAGQLEEWV